jgi:hypothetical protein
MLSMVKFVVRQAASVGADSSAVDVAEEADVAKRGTHVDRPLGVVASGEGEYHGADLAWSTSSGQRICRCRDQRAEGDIARHDGLQKMGERQR